MSRKTILILAVSIPMGLAALIAFYWGTVAFDRASHARLQAAEPDGATGTSALGRAGTTAQRDGELAVTAVVQSRTTIGESYSDLRSFAELGNSFAAYQLFEDLLECSLASERTRHLEQFAERAGTEEAITHAAKGIEAANEKCEDVSDDALAERTEWLKLAARQGHLVAKANFYKFALAEFDNPALAVSEAERLALLRDEAIRHLHDAAAAGNVDAIGSLANQYADGGLVRPDPLNAYVYTAAMRELVGSPGYSLILDRISQGLSSSELAEAQRRADGFIASCCR